MGVSALCTGPTIWNNKRNLVIGIQSITEKARIVLIDEKTKRWHGWSDVILRTPLKDDKEMSLVVTAPTVFAFLTSWRLQRAPRVNESCPEQSFKIYCRQGTIAHIKRPFCLLGRTNGRRTCQQDVRTLLAYNRVATAKNSSTCTECAASWGRNYGFLV